MKIVSVKTHVVHVPRVQEFEHQHRTALGSTRNSEHGIVLVETDEGIVGEGEIASVFRRRGKLLCREVDEFLAPAVLGEDPFRIAHLVERMDLALDGSEPAKAGIEMAVFDIVGKALGTPVYNLLGGRVRDAVRLSVSIPFGAPEEMADYARRMVERGFGTVKVKVGRDPADDLRAVEAVRAAVGPDVRVRVDANMAWRTPKDAVAIIRAMEPYRLELVEQPLPPRELDGMAEIRARVDVPIMADESLWTPRDAMEIIRRRAADVANVYVAEAGGLLKASRIFSMCEAAGIPCMIGSMPELGIGTAAQIHLGVAMTNLKLDSDTCGVIYHAGDVLASPLRIEAGYAHPPTGPGLGVDVDTDRLQRFAPDGDRR